MLCIARGPAASRPTVGTYNLSSITHYYYRPRYANKWFSQSLQRLARPKHYTPEQLAAFTNHYETLGLDHRATDREIKQAYNLLSKRFHPDMMRNVDSKEYWNNPDRPEFVKIKDSKDLLLDPARRKAYDAEYNAILDALRPVMAEKRAARGVDSKRAIAWNLRLEHPTTHQDGSPMRNHCVVQVSGLPPQVTIVDFVRAIAEISPVGGRIIDCKLTNPSQTRVDRGAYIEFADDSHAQNFGLFALRGKFHVLRKTVWYCKLVPAAGQALRPPPPGATRVLSVDGPRDHKLMTVSALGEFFGRNIEDVDGKLDSYRVMDSAKGPNSVTIEWTFTTWRRCAVFAFAALRRHYPGTRRFATPKSEGATPDIHKQCLSPKSPPLSQPFLNLI